MLDLLAETLERVRSSADRIKNVVSMAVEGQELQNGQLTVATSKVQVEDFEKYKTHFDLQSSTINIT